MDRTVGFHVRVRDMLEELREKKDEKEKEMETMSKVVKKANMAVDLAGDLVDKLEDLSDHQSYMQQRESVHRDLAESTFNHLIGWTLAEAAVLMVVAGGQIVYLRKFFEQRRYL